MPLIQHPDANELRVHTFPEEAKLSVTGARLSRFCLCALSPASPNLKAFNAICVDLAEFIESAKIILSLSTYLSLLKLIISRKYLDTLINFQMHFSDN